jgi:hypothetical protein
MVPFCFAAELKTAAPFYLYHGAGYCDASIMALLLLRGTDHISS